MKKMILLVLALCTFPITASALKLSNVKITATSPEPNTYTREYSSTKEGANYTNPTHRFTPYPTQIVRVTGKVRGLNLTCDQVFDVIEKFFIKHITYDKFFYNTISYCGYNPKTSLATNFTINSYFDPLNDEAIAYLEKYNAHHNGRKLLGATFNVESAKGLVVSMNIDVGIEDPDNPSTLLRLAYNNASYYYDNHYDMITDLLTDIYRRFYSTDENVILPFIDKWFLTSTDYYSSVLSKSDYAELQPEITFLMESGDKVFTPHLRLYYSHHCSNSENKHCL